MQSIQASPIVVRNPLRSPLASAAAAVLALATSLAAPGTASAQGAAAVPSSCSPVGDLSFVCGLTNVEDFLPVEGGRWLVGGSFKEGSAGLYLIDTASKTAKAVMLTIAATPDPIYAGCQAPDLKKLSTHGLDVKPGPTGTTTVYAVNHGGHEAVEVFRLTASKGSAEWIGCVAMPANTSTNSVAALPGGGFVATKFLDTSDKAAFQTILAGKVNGTVYRWTPGKGLSEVPGSQLSGDNGIAVSADGKWVYVNAYGTNEIYKLPLSGSGQKAVAKVDFHPDNLRWSPDGKLFVTGQFLSSPNSPTPPPGKHTDWATVRLDPATMAVTPVVKEAGLAEFEGATSCVQVGKTLWFGTYRGDRMAYRAAP